MNLGQRWLFNQKLFSDRLLIPDLKALQMREADVCLASVFQSAIGVDLLARLHGPCLMLHGSSVVILLLCHCSSFKHLGFWSWGLEQPAKVMSLPRGIPYRAKRGGKSPSPGIGAVTVPTFWCDLSFFVTCCSEWNEFQVAEGVFWEAVDAFQSASLLCGWIDRGMCLFSSLSHHQQYSITLSSSTTGSLYWKTKCSLCFLVSF